MFVAPSGTKRAIWVPRTSSLKCGPAGSNENSEMWRTNAFTLEKVFGPHLAKGVGVHLLQSSAHRQPHCIMPIKAGWQGGHRCLCAQQPGKSSGMKKRKAGNVFGLSSSSHALVAAQHSDL